MTTTPLEADTCDALVAYERAITAWHTDPPSSALTHAKLCAGRAFMALDVRCRAEREELGLTSNPGRLARAASSTAPRSTFLDRFRATLRGARR